MELGARRYAVLITLFVLASVFCARADEMFRSDAAHIGVYASQPASLTHVRWRFRAKAAFVSSPTLANGVVFIGSDDKNVYAVRARTGELLWKYATGGRVRSTPAISNGRVFISSLDGNVYALDAATGKEIWTFSTGGERRFTAPGIHGITPKNEMMPDPFDLFLSSPAVRYGIVYIGSGDHSVYALDARTGAQKWKFTTGDVVHASPAVANGLVYIGSWDRNFYALDARNGSLKWKYQTGDDQVIHNQVGIQGSATVANGMVYFGCRDSHLYALDATTGSLKWRHDDHGSWVVGTPSVKDGAIYFTTSDEKKFVSLDARSGKQRFSVPYGMFSYSSPSIAGNVAYFGTFEGILYAINTSDGRILEQFSSDGARAHRAEHLDRQGHIDDATFYPDGTLDGITIGLSRIYTMGSFAGSPVINGGVLYVGDMNGVLYAIG